MIDDPATVDKLMKQMQVHLPIPASPTSQLARMLRQQGLKLRAGRAVFIQRVFYLGDEGGISCDITPAGDTKTPLVVSLTHLRIAPGHPLYRDIRQYQRERVERMSELQP